jgi:hypothetical protein
VAAVDAAGGLHSDVSMTGARAGERLAAALAIVDARLARQPRPADAMPFNDNSIYDVYAPSVRAVEARTEAALRAYVTALAQWNATRDAAAAIEWHLDDAQVPLGAGAQPRPLAQHTHAAVAALDYSATGSLADMGRAQKKGDDVRLPLDVAKVRAALAAAVLRDLVDAAGVKAAGDALAYVAARRGAWADAQAAWTLVFDDEGPRIIRRLADITVFEQADYLLTYADTVGRIFADAPDAWARMLAAAGGTAALQAAYVSDAERRFQQLDDVCTAYAHGAPLLSPADAVPAAPTKRNCSVLFATREGEYANELYAVSRPLLPPRMTFHFAAELRPAAPSLATYGARGWHPLDRVHEFFAGRALASGRGALDARYAAVRALP